MKRIHSFSVSHTPDWDGSCTINWCEDDDAYSVTIPAEVIVGLSTVIGGANGKLRALTEVLEPLETLATCANPAPWRKTPFGVVDNNLEQLFDEEGYINEPAETLIVGLRNALPRLLEILREAL